MMKIRQEGQEWSMYDILTFTTLYTGPKPPSPSLFSSEKLSVASSMSSKSKTENSESSASISQSTPWWG